MKASGTNKRTDNIVMCITALLFVVLILLTVLIIKVFNRSQMIGDNGSFDLGSITSDRLDAKIDVPSLILPEFLGITIDGDRYGTATSWDIITDRDIITELYRFVMPVISDTVREENISAGTSDDWNRIAKSDASVYLRYHAQMPDIVIALLADIYTGRSFERKTVGAYVYEMFIVPRFGEQDAVEIAVKDDDGGVYIYRESLLDSGVTRETLLKMVRSYKRSMTPFEFSFGKFESASETEPVFTSSLITRRILMTNNTVSLIENSDNELKRFMRIFSMNSDKLLNTRPEGDGVSSYVDMHGVLYRYESLIEYRAAADGGVPVVDMIGYRATLTLEDYLTVAAKIYAEIHAINENYIGGEADIVLTYIYAANGTVRMSFEYVYDNILITGIEPAMTLEFSDGKLVKASIYAFAAHHFGAHSESFIEWWFFGYLKDEGIVPSNVTLVYRSDFISNSIAAEWTAAVPTKKRNG